MSGFFLNDQMYIVTTIWWLQIETFINNTSSFLCMTYKLTDMKGDEFVKKILEGERNFRNIRLEEGFDLSGHPSFMKMQNYLRRESGLDTSPLLGPGYEERVSPNHLRESPIDISNSELRHLIARGIYLPYTRGINADLSYSDLSGIARDEHGRNFRGTNLSYSDFENAIFYRVNLADSDFTGAKFRGANFENAVLGTGSIYHWTEFNNANLCGINFCNAKFDQTILRGADVKDTDFSVNFNGADIRGIKNLEKSIGLGSAVFYMTDATQKEIDIIRNASRRFVLHDK